MNIRFPVVINVNRIFFGSVALTLFWMILMGSLVKPLNSKDIVAFELAKTSEVAMVITKEWQDSDLIGKAKKSIYLDFVFLVLYSASIGLGCVVLSRLTKNAFFVKTGYVLSRVVPLAGLCDLIENVAMLKTLVGEVESMPVAIAFWFACIKFLIVGVSLVFVLLCLIAGIAKRMMSK